MKYINEIRLRADILALVSALIWISVTIYGEFFNGAANSACYRLLGCDSGFFGYDALEHFLFGFVSIWTIVWLCQKFPRYSLLNGERLKSGFVLLATAIFIAVVWEMGECFRDAYLLNIMHEDLLNLTLKINYLAQPSNIDTMGDLTFNSISSLSAIFLLNKSTVMQ